MIQVLVLFLFSWISNSNYCSSIFLALQNSPIQRLSTSGTLQHPSTAVPSLWFQQTLTVDVTLRWIASSGLHIFYSHWLSGSDVLQPRFVLRSASNVKIVGECFLPSSRTSKLQLLSYSHERAQDDLWKFPRGPTGIDGYGGKFDSLWDLNLIKRPNDYFQFQLNVYCSVILLTYVLALFAYLFIEKPCDIIFKQLFDGKPATKQEKGKQKVNLFYTATKLLLMLQLFSICMIITLSIAMILFENRRFVFERV